MSQAGPMMGMQQGMGPNAHALSHLQPQQAHMFQQQQMSKCSHGHSRLVGANQESSESCINAAAQGYTTAGNASTTSA
jgi:hypothetical protein